MSVPKANVLVAIVVATQCGCRAAGQSYRPVASLPAANARAAEPLVNLSEIDSRIQIDLRYATRDNFLNRILYDDARCFVRREAALRLRAVQDDLICRGMGLVVYDGYRPLRVQRMMWAVLPDPDYVADPARGSRHNRGAAVDVGLVDLAGNRLPMPTAFDAFTPAARRDAFVADSEARANREILTHVMRVHGFSGLNSEWWHFDLEHWSDYPIVSDIEDAKLRRAGIGG